jgi:multicomponent Na+:H+ antiporter subunit B
MNLNFFEKFAIKTITSAVLFFCIILSLHIHIFGKITAGGGFQAGALLASGIIIYEYFNQITLISKKHLNILTFCGLATYFATGVSSIVLGGDIFEYSVFGAEYGHVFGSFCVETGVFFVVTSAMIRLSHLISKN